MRRARGSLSCWRARWRPFWSPGPPRSRREALRNQRVRRLNREAIRTSAGRLELHRLRPAAAAANGPVRVLVALEERRSHSEGERDQGRRDAQRQPAQLDPVGSSAATAGRRSTHRGTRWNGDLRVSGRSQRHVRDHRRDEGRPAAGLRVENVRPARIVRPDNVQAAQYVNAPQVWDGPTGFTGEGVTIGVIDTGIDYTPTSAVPAPRPPTTTPTRATRRSRATSSTRRWSAVSTSSATTTTPRPRIRRPDSATGSRPAGL